MRQIGCVHAIQALGLEKSASGWMDFVNNVPDMVQHFPAMADAGRELVGQVPGMLGAAGKALIHAPGDLLHGLRHLGGEYGGQLGTYLGPMAAEGLPLHVGANYGMRRFLHSPRGVDFETELTAQGIRHGMAGKHMSPLITMPVTGYAGPELVSSYNAGHYIGQKLQNATPEQRNRVLANSEQLLSDPAVAASPAGYLKDALGRAMQPEPDTKGRRILNELFLRDAPPSATEKALALGLTAGSAALDPTGVAKVHVGLNGLRQTLGTSSIGAKTMADGFKDGLLGEAPSAELAKDLIISPALLHPQRVGYALHQAAKERPRETANNAFELAKSVTDLPGVREPVQKKIDDVSRQVADTTAQGVRMGRDKLREGFEAMKNRVLPAWADPNVRRKAMLGAGALGAGALGYGAYRMYQNHKERKKQEAIASERQRVLQEFREFMAQRRALGAAQ